MFKKLLLCCCVASIFVACTNDSATKNAASQAENAAILDSIINVPLKEENLYARANQGMAKLMMDYTQAAGMIDGFDNPHYTMDEKCNVRFMYEEKGVSYEKRLCIGDLAHAGGKMSLQAEDGVDIKYPGFILRTEDGEASVEVYKEGKLLQKDNQWYIVLGTRAAVESAVPRMVNVINVCRQIHGKK